MTSPAKRPVRFQTMEDRAKPAPPRLRAVAAAAMLLVSGAALAQQTISTSTTSRVYAVGGDLLIESGVVVGSNPGINPPLLVNYVDVDSVTNNGSLLTTNDAGISLHFNSLSSLATITNNGISKGGIRLLSAAHIVNNGSIYGKDKGITVYASATGSSISNKADLNAIRTSSNAILNYSGSTLVSVSNAAQGVIGGNVPIYNLGVITTLTNLGTIQSFHHVPSNAIAGSGSITHLVNRGSVLAAGSEAAINTNVVNLANAQGGNTPLSINLQPTHYAIIVNSPTAYGKLSVLNASGAMGFGVYAGSVVTPGYYYSAVLSGVRAPFLSNTSGSYSGTPWSLSLAAGSDSTWNLCLGIAACSFTLTSNMLPGQTYASSSLGGSVNRLFDGGNLQMSEPSTVAGDFTITANNGTIDQRGEDSTFSGNFADASVGQPGKLTIANSGAAGAGSITLAGTNTHTGGIDVLPGAWLVIHSPAALGSGKLALIGSATVPSALRTTQSMTLSNAITVSGDPIFNVAPGTTLTVDSAIADGTMAGDIEVQGGGRLLLTAANTYSGPTLIDVGSTLALAGAGSITPSSVVTNRGLLDASAAAPVVRLAGSYTQASTGHLTLQATPAQFQKLEVAGPAALAGTLALNASAGAYRMGRYTLLTASTVSGRFETFSTNLAALTPLGHSLSYGADGVYLDLAASPAYTLQSIEDSSRQLALLHSLQGTALQSGLAHGCGTFDQRGLCVGIGGRRSLDKGSAASHTQAAQVVVAYRPAPTLQIGAFADSAADIDVSSNLSLRNDRPMVGVFGQWSRNGDGSGLAMRVSAAVSDAQVAITRSGGSFSETGQGRTRTSGRGFQWLASYAQPRSSRFTATPYAGLRHTRIRTAGYSETAGTEVRHPLSFDALTQTTVTALAGVGFQARLAEKLAGSITVGVQHHLSRSMDPYAGSSQLPGLSRFDVEMPQTRRTLVTASAGLGYQIGNSARFGLNLAWQEQSIGKSVLTASAGYTFGF